MVVIDWRSPDEQPVLRHGGDAADQHGGQLGQVASAGPSHPPATLRPSGRGRPASRPAARSLEEDLLLDRLPLEDRHRDGRVPCSLAPYRQRVFPDCQGYLVDTRLYFLGAVA